MTATVLVLEENAAVQELIEQTLRESGHRVLTTKNPLEALEVARRIRIDVLVAGDLLERQLSAIVDELVSIQPDLRVVSICGSDDLAQHVPDAELPCPFSLEDLRAAVASGLERA